MELFFVLISLWEKGVAIEREKIYVAISEIGQFCETLRNKITNSINLGKIRNFDKMKEQKILLRLLVRMLSRHVKS